MIMEPMENKYSAEELLARWLQGDLSQEELKLLESQFDLKSMKHAVDKVGHFKTPAFQPSASWQALLAKKHARQKTKERRIRVRWIMSAAAALLLALGIWWLIPTKNQVHIIQTALQEQRQVQLPDGTLVFVNADSKIEYTEEEWIETRLLRLEGEAFFDVEPGSTFTVHTPLGSITVLGTKFNVWARAGLLDVYCEEGTVWVQNQVSQDTINPEERTRSFNQAPLETTQPTKIQTPSWKEGTLLTFDSIPLPIVLEELKRQYGLKIQGAIKPNLIYSGRIPKNNLNRAVELVCKSFDLDYDLRSEVLILK